ncbi:MAG: hypothetical protein R3A79_24800 [Nannocystaceae bacterium]
MAQLLRTPRIAFASLLIASPLLAAPLPVAAADSEAAQGERTAADFAGSFRYVGGDGERERAHAAVDEIVEELNVLIRGTARRLLRKTATPASAIAIKVEGDVVTIDAGKDPIPLTLGGAAVEFRGEDGKHYSMTARLRGDKLVLRIVGNGSTTVKTYRLGGDGARLTVKTTIDHPMMHKPLEYAFSFRRK